MEPNNPTPAGVRLREENAATMGPVEIVKIIEAAGVVVTTAATVAKEAKPLVDNMDTQPMVDAAASGIKAAADGAGKAIDAVKSAGDTTVKAVGSVIGRIGDTKDNMVGRIAAARSAADLKKAFKEARRTVLDNATVSMPLKEFLEKYAAVSDPHTGGPAIVGKFGMPGCFVIATYKRFDPTRDVTDYTGVYVGDHPETIAQGIVAAVSRHGNPDVYADLKFHQNMQVFAFNCLPELIADQHYALIRVFRGEELYNEEPTKADEVDEALEALAAMADMS